MNSSTRGKFSIQCSQSYWYGEHLQSISWPSKAQPPNPAIGGRYLVGSSILSAWAARHLAVLHVGRYDCYDCYTHEVFFI